MRPGLGRRRGGQRGHAAGHGGHAAGQKTPAPEGFGLGLAHGLVPSAESADQAVRSVSRRVSTPATAQQQQQQPMLVSELLTVPWDPFWFGVRRSAEAVGSIRVISIRVMAMPLTREAYRPFSSPA
jgi:hypothetical protein